MSVGAEQRDLAQRGVAAGRDHLGVAVHLDPGGAEALARLPDLRGGVDDDHLGARGVQRLGGLVTGMVRGEHDDVLPDQHTEALEVGPGGRGEHHARPVVADERQRSLVRAGGEHDPLGADVVDHVVRPVALIAQDVAVVVDPGRGRVRQRGDAGRRLEDDVVLVDQQHPAARRRGLQRGDPPGGARPDDQHLDVTVHMAGGPRIDRRLGQQAHAGSAGHPQTVN